MSKVENQEFKKTFDFDNNMVNISYNSKLNNSWYYDTEIYLSTRPFQSNEPGGIVKEMIFRNAFKGNTRSYASDVWTNMLFELGEGIPRNASDDFHIASMLISSENPIPVPKFMRANNIKNVNTSKIISDNIIEPLLPTDSYEIITKPNNMNIELTWITVERIQFRQDLLSNGFTEQIDIDGEHYYSIEFSLNDPMFEMLKNSNTGKSKFRMINDFNKANSYQSAIESVELRFYFKNSSIQLGLEEVTFDLIWSIGTEI